MRPPILDSRELSDLERQMKEMVPFYTPEWRFTPDLPDPGTALFYLFADMFLGNISRFNQAPLKNYIAYLNSIGVSPLPAKPSHAYVTFHLTEGAPSPVLIPKATVLSASVPGRAEPVLFETVQPIIATPSKVASIFNVMPARDLIAPVLITGSSDSDVENNVSVSLFHSREEDNLQEHSLYISHRELFLFENPTKLELVMFRSSERYKDHALYEKLTNSAYVEWAYGSSDNWVVFDEVKVVESGIQLLKRQQGRSSIRLEGGQENRWIRCRIKQGVIAAVSPDKQELLVDTIRVRGESDRDSLPQGFAPDNMFYNDTQVDPSGFYPFGEYFAPYGMLHIASTEAFSKRGSLVTLKFRMKCVRAQMMPEPDPEIEWKLIMKQSAFKKREIPETAIERVLWEYWNGRNWARLETEAKYELMFNRPEDEDVEMTFICPLDMSETLVNGQENYWIRIRVHQIDNLYANNPTYASPWIEQVGFLYTYMGHDAFAPESCLTYNNLIFKDVTQAVTKETQTIELFELPDSEYPAVYFGFATPPVKGPISVYIAVAQQALSADQVPALEWEYLGDELEPVWSSFKMQDETLGFTRSGTLQFIGPTRFVKRTLFNQDMYWIRAVNVDRKLEHADQPAPMLTGVHMNTVRVIQQESINMETPEQIGSSEHPIYRITKAPLMNEQVWIDETDALNESQLAELQQQGHQVNVIRDSGKQIHIIWVLWERVDRLMYSGSEQRHYELDTSTGILQFGDGKRGKLLPRQGGDRVKVTYMHIAGKAGNVERGMISNLQQSISFVQRVQNFEPAGGGCDAEMMEETLRRGPFALRHRNRAVTTEDFEWLAREAYQDIAKIICLGGFNTSLEKELGCVTLVVYPKGGLSSMLFFPEIKRQIEQYVQERASNSVAYPGKISVVAPIFMEISIRVKLIATDADQILSLETSVVSRLTQFLDPIYGNFDGQGWNIGQVLHRSSIYALLRSISGVKTISDLQLTVILDDRETRKELPETEMAAMTHGLIVSGVHQAIVDIDSL